MYTAVAQYSVSMLINAPPLKYNKKINIYIYIFF